MTQVSQIPVCGFLFIARLCNFASIHLTNLKLHQWSTNDTGSPKWHWWSSNDTGSSKWHSAIWGLPVPFEIYQCHLRSTSAIWDLAVSFEIYQCHLRSTSAIWDLAVPFEDNQCHLRSSSAIWGQPVSFESSNSTGWFILVLFGLKYLLLLGII